jgi:hypothetical protein
MNKHGSKSTILKVSAWDSGTLVQEKEKINIETRVFWSREEIDERYENLFA